ncbi:asparagine synthase (glutamine-hydrolyzing) [Kerstersia similis]|uniref:asparagine synthase (glutamine-hydrolyzing) n=1 Tax=Kerstersia similis TaxID=206505 RepID=UPI0039EF0955
MCGISGGFWNGRSVDDGREARLAQSLVVMALRGPDDRGFEMYAGDGGEVGLGHTRLSIIDLSSAGHQPMSSRDGQLSMVFNGEIYNYKELRAELAALGYLFCSDSDTEVLLNAWHAWGKDVLPRLIGMFAFVIYDRKQQQMHCVRDAFGIKPFFYSKGLDEFVFASEIGAIKALKKSAIALNWQRSYDYLVHGDYDSGEQTFIADVFHLLPGHCMVLDTKTGILGTPLPWWQPETREQTNLSLEQATDAVRELFLKNVRLQLRSDVPLGAALSGGVDSSAVVCAMRHVEPDLPINTFSYIAHGADVSEEVWVDRINGQVGARGHKVRAGGKDLAQDLDDLIRAQGEPFGSTSIYAQYRVFKLARESGVTVTLDGQGADEMLAGYDGYPGERIRSLLETGQVGEAWHFLNAWSQWPGRSRAKGGKLAVAEFVDGWLYRMLHQWNGTNYAPSWIRTDVMREAGVSVIKPGLHQIVSDRGRRLAGRLAQELTQSRLPPLLRHGDRNSMRFSVESRVPFLTLEMVNLLLSLPESWLISRDGETKHIFRRAMRGIVPDEVLDRKDKIGFVTPERIWLLEIQEQIRDWLKEDVGLVFLNQQAMLAEFDAIVAGKAKFSWRVWRWINFIRWYRYLFLDGGGHA